MFTSARIKLTAWYLLIITIILTFFSVFIYNFLSNEVDRFADSQRFRIERQLNFAPPKELFDQSLVEELKQRIIIYLLVVDGSILIISGSLSFFLAGRTLKPINLMVEEQNRFISDASHELRTPLTALKSSLEVFIRDKSPTIKDATNMAKNNIIQVNQLKSLTDSLLELSQYEKPNAHTTFTKVSIGEVISDSIKRVKILASQKNISIVNRVKDCSLKGNKYSLTDLFVTLLDNAIKYSDKNKKIIIESKKTNHFVHVSVVDQGIGIKKIDIPHLFDRFYRADNVRSKDDSNGYGLGLSIAKKIVDLHRGNILVQSQYKKGTTFIIKLPFSLV